jgi:hypothetical protein
MCKRSADWDGVKRSKASVEIVTLWRRSGAEGSTSLGKGNGSDSGGSELGEASKEKEGGPSSTTRCVEVDGPTENPERRNRW